MKTPSVYEQLDLSIPNMDTPEAEEAARGVLHSLPGVHAVRLIERGAWLEYDPAFISHERIIADLHRTGIRASLFQDSGTGEARTSKI